MSGKPWDARLAAALVRPFIHSRYVHPNHFTALRLVVGCAGALCFASGIHANLGAGLIVASNFLDHTDGELARESGKTTRFGHYFDLFSDALVTVGLFAGIGVGLADGPLGYTATLLGAMTGAAIAGIFHLRDQIERHHGKHATRQPRWGGVEAEDILYLLPLVTFSDSLAGFLQLAAIGAPIAFLLVLGQYLRVMRRPAGSAP